MIALDQSSVERTLEDFRVKKVMSIHDLLGSMHCSTITVRRYLRQWKTLTSYNKNGCYYVLPDIPKFNEYGLWQYKSIRFSKYGTLKQTIIHLVEDSISGKDASEITQLVAMDPHSILSRLIGQSVLQRKKMSGVFVYFPVDEKRLKNQFEKRLELSKNSESSTFLSDTVGVAILVERIKDPKLTSPGLSRRLQSHGIKVSSKMIDNFFLYHGILKKTPDSVSS